MVYLKWLALMPASFIMAIIGRLLAPILPFFVDKETHRLPRWLSWFATDDNDADGDAGIGRDGRALIGGVRTKGASPGSLEMSAMGSTFKCWASPFIRLMTGR